MSIDERAVVEHFHQMLDGLDGCRVWKLAPLANNQDIKNELQAAFGFVPVLNELDLIVSKDRQLVAAEVKLIRPKAGGIKGGFYQGIGQALSLLRWGFDSVALWHVFSPEFDADDASRQRRDRYAAGAWSFLRNDMRLPLDFTYYQAHDCTEGVSDITALQYTDRATGIEVCSVSDPRLDWWWRQPNPLLDTSLGRHMRAAMARALDIPPARPGTERAPTSTGSGVSLTSGLGTSLATTPLNPPTLMFPDARKPEPNGSE